MKALQSFFLRAGILLVIFDIFGNLAAGLGSLKNLVRNGQIAILLVYNLGLLLGLIFLITSFLIKIRIKKQAERRDLLNAFREKPQ